MGELITVKYKATVEKILNILKENAPIHLKTDSQFLHGFTLGVITDENHILEDTLFFITVKI